MPDRVDELAPLLHRVVRADGTDPAALRALRIHEFDTVVVAIGDNVESSVITVLNCRDLGVPYLVAQAQDEAHGRILKRLGVDRVVYPQRDMGIRVASNIATGGIIDYVRLSDEYGLAEITPPRSVLGQEPAGAGPAPPLRPERDGHQAREADHRLPAGRRAHRGGRRHGGHRQRRRHHPAPERIGGGRSMALQHAAEGAGLHAASGPGGGLCAADPHRHRPAGPARRPRPPGSGSHSSDALFMATSAVCVTGLAVVDVSTTFSAFGEIVSCSWSRPAAWAS